MRTRLFSYGVLAVLAVMVAGCGQRNANRNTNQNANSVRPTIVRPPDSTFVAQPVQQVVATSTNQQLWPSTEEWNSYLNQKYGFRLQYPPFMQETADGTESFLWQHAGKIKGRRIVSFSIDHELEPDTNLVGATVTFGMSSDKKAVLTCLKPDDYQDTGRTRTISGIPFRQFSRNGSTTDTAYEVTSYRALPTNEDCFVIESIIYYGDMAEYPVVNGVRPFNRERAVNLLDRIVSTIQLGYYR